MARTKRLKVLGEGAYYHIISRTVGQNFLLNDLEKENFFSIIRRFSSLYFVKVIGYSIMSNHFHLLIKMGSWDEYKDEEILHRLKTFYKKESQLWPYKLGEYRRKLSDISEYVKAIKQTFSVWYNRSNGRKGYFWSDRFKSVLLEKGDTLLNCLAYIDLNPVRAGIVSRPEDYRWSSFGYRIQSGNRDNFLSFEGVFDNVRKEMMEKYREFIYMAGGMEKEGSSKIPEDIIDMEIGNGFKLESSRVFRYRLRCFSDGLVLGSKDFIREAYIKFGGIVILKKERKAHITMFSDKIFSVRRLKET